MWSRFAGVFGLAAALALTGCASDWEDKYEQAQRDNLDLVLERDQASQERAQAYQEIDGLKAQLAAQQDEARRAAAEAEAARRRAEELAAAQAARPATPVVDDGAARERQAAALRARYDNVSVTPEGNIEILLESDVAFASGSDVLTEAGKRSLMSLAGELNGNFGAYMIRVEGHTDAEPLKRTREKYGDNFGLGSARSLSVLRFMEKEMKIAPTRLMSASKGEHEPIAPNTTPEGRKKNRRVEVVVVIPPGEAEAMAK